MLRSKTRQHYSYCEDHVQSKATVALHDHLHALRRWRTDQWSPDFANIEQTSKYPWLLLRSLHHDY